MRLSHPHQRVSLWHPAWPATAGAGLYTGGEFTTPPLRFEGAELVLNVDTAAGGEVRVEVRDVEGAPIAGFQLDDLKENDEYRFVSERADNATTKYGVKSVSILAIKR